MASEKYPLWQRWLEMSAVVITGVCKFIFVDVFPFKGWYVAIACCLWISYVVYLAATYKSRLISLGFTKEGFKKSFARLLPVATICLLLFLGVGVANNSMLFNLNIIFVLLLYPVWGVIQQFLMMALFAGNLYELTEGKWPKAAILGATAIVFSMVHLPSGVLTGGTFVLALVYTDHYLYRQHRNLWVLGIYHGWLGCFFYYWVLQRDAWIEIIKVFQ
jgi:uncharacterized protein